MINKIKKQTVENKNKIPKVSVRGDEAKVWFLSGVKNNNPADIKVSTKEIITLFAKLIFLLYYFTTKQDYQVV